MLQGVSAQPLGRAGNICRDCGGLRISLNAVGASLLAKNLRALLCVRHPALSLTPFASKLAPTGVIRA
ncbi:hypothetical protein C7A11_12420 [Pseudomonas simiae]|nr:hypothetical protein C7A11_12420 [Pseudomonas simiae]